MAYRQYHVTVACHPLLCAAIKTTQDMLSILNTFGSDKQAVWLQIRLEAVLVGSTLHVLCV